MIKHRLKSERLMRIYTYKNTVNLSASGSEICRKIISFQEIQRF